MADYCDVKYMGGHTEYPKPSDCRIYFFNDRIEFKNPPLTIPYQSMTRVENGDEKRISALREVLFGINGTPWKKNLLYTIIQYSESMGERTIIVDFDDLGSVMQPFIYRRMIRYRRPVSLKSENNFFVYENNDHGFKVRYPQTWYEDELNQENEGYTTIVEFRMLIERKPPSFTIYVTDLESLGISFEDFVTKEIEDVINDSNLSLIETSDTVIANRPGIKLVDVENQGYKRMVHWISSKNNIFELSYASEQSKYSEYLSDVDSMINSFELIDGITTVTEGLQTEKIDNQEYQDDPLVILKRRFAKGEINEEEFKRMRSVLEG